ncbi:MAG: hypothetical protein WCL04_07380 [Verrucomicrobiota bacterium]
MSSSSSFHPHPSGATINGLRAHIEAGGGTVDAVMKFLPQS